MEIWKDIKGYEGLYQVSNLGRVKACEKRWVSHHNSILYHTERILKPLDNHGYLRVSLCKNNHYKKYPIHRLVADAFIPNPLNKPFINHKNFDRTNNRVENLEWVNHKENMEYSSKNCTKAALKRWKPKSTEHYIHIFKNKYRVELPKKYGRITKVCETLDDAIKFRDERIGIK